MPKAKSSAKSSFSPLQFIAPGLLLFCFILFFLPWVELVVVPTTAAKKMATELKQEAPKRRAMFSQSGLQIATADVTVIDPDLKKFEKEAKKEGPWKDDKERDEHKAPALFLYPVLLLAGIALSFVPIPPIGRRIAVASCAGLALLLALIFTAFALPVEQETRKAFEKAKEAQKKMMDSMPKELQSKVEKPDNEVPFAFPWQVCFYLTALLLLAAAGAAFADGFVAGGGAKGKYGRKGRRDDYDEDDFDDEDDDRPRKKSRRDERDEDEDDRPRKKRRDEEEDERPSKKRRRDEEEDEDDRPRKKSRRDDDEGDDRPRKKKALEPEFEMPTEAPLPPPPPAAPAGPNPFAFDDEPAPKKKPRRRDEDDDDYDDRPRKKRRRDDDD